MYLDVIADLFSSTGLLYRPPLNDLFSYREEQSRYALAIAASLADESDGKFSIYNASGGMGKTIGYLLPAVLYSLMNGVTIAVATSTISLRDDILAKEREKIRQVIIEINRNDTFRERHGLPILPIPDIGVRRSPRQYIGDAWLDDAILTGSYPELTRYFSEKQRLIDDYFSDHDSLPDGLTIADICLQATDKGPSREMWMNDNERAQGMNVILVTQAFLLSDFLFMKKKDNRHTCYLEDIHAVIVDEAEHLGSAASMLEYRITTREMKGIVPAKLITALEKHLEGMLSHTADNTLYTAWQDLGVDDDGHFLVSNSRHRTDLIEPLMEHLRKIEQALDGKGNASQDISRMMRDFQMVIDNTRSIDAKTTFYVRRIVNHAGETYELRKVYNIASEPLKRIYWNVDKMILTSAFIKAPGKTLKESIRQFGIPDTQVVHHGEFNVRSYGKAGLIVNGWTYPVHEMSSDGVVTTHTHLSMCADAGAYAASHGRAVMLCSSYRDMTALSTMMAERGTRVMVVERGMNAGAFRHAFTTDNNFILVMTAWEGVDLPNIDHLIIAKIPASPIDDHKALALKNISQTAGDYSSVTSMRKLAQGFARAIRDKDNKAIIWMMDPRFFAGRKEVTLTAYRGLSVAKPFRRSYIDCFPSRFSDELDDYLMCLPDDGTIAFTSPYLDTVEAREFFIEKDPSFEKCFA